MKLSNYCDICGESSDDLVTLFAGPRVDVPAQRELPLAEVCNRCLTYDLVQAVAAQGLCGAIRYAERLRASA